MYPAIIIIIVCTQIGQDTYTTRQEHTNMNLTAVELPVGATTFESSQFASTGSSSSNVKETSWPSAKHTHRDQESHELQSYLPSRSKASREHEGDGDVVDVYPL